ncbi:hypothetical protein [Photorhabdus bodei]|uniref:hypothetical protein n=1 Tax=Photorhabdus bodei TaxID=2029681 RepID=UPI001E555C97|nr:hypothetical protein [Photorhabdus bodei]MCC8464402.1 hypothetical protein [Photorhabdus bodei]
MKWDDDFIVSPSPTKLFNKNRKKLVYQFMNGDMMIVDYESEKHYFIYNKKKAVECHKGPDKNVFPVILGIYPMDFKMDRDGKEVNPREHR